MVMTKIDQGSGSTTPVTYEDLYQAAQGRRQNLEYPQEARVVNSAYKSALGNALGQGFSPATMYQGMISPGQTASSQSYTPMYSTINANIGIGSTPGANYGLSSKGKYGGFYTTDQLKTAVGAEAMGLRASIEEQLRQLATQRYNELDKMYQTSGRIVSPTSKTPYAVAPYSPINEAASAYRAALGKWYSENAAPAEEALKTAQQVETTPLSQYAQTIAVNRYGMNPNLAAGTFSNLDAEMYQTTRNQDYMRMYGMPYDQVQDIIKQQQDSLKLQPDYGKQLETLTGAPATQLQQASGLTPERMYGIIQAAKPVTITVKNEQYPNGVEVRANGPGVLEQVNNALLKNDSDSAIAMVEAVEAIDPQFASLLYSYLARDTEIRKKIKDKISYLPDVFATTP